MRLRRAELGLFVSIALWGGLAHGQAVLGDGVAAIVGSTVPEPKSVIILRSDVTLRARMLLLGRGGERTLSDPLPDSLLATVLQSLIDEALIALESQRIDLPAPTRAALDRERARLTASVGGEQRMKLLVERALATKAEIEAIVDRRARITGFLELHLGGENLVAEHEVKRRYAEGNHPFSELSYEDAAAPLRVMLLDERIGQAVADWVAILRERTPVVVRAAPWRSGSSSGP